MQTCRDESGRNKHSMFRFRFCIMYLFNFFISCLISEGAITYFDHRRLQLINENLETLEEHEQELFSQQNVGGIHHTLKICLSGDYISPNIICMAPKVPLLNK
ncbi:hypothetical protein P8452_29553 [Trifolium repens]|nr:hypothetical protein P8452_29553 [Trifolium repens]